MSAGPRTVNTASSPTGNRSGKSIRNLLPTVSQLAKSSPAELTVNCRRTLPLMGASLYLPQKVSRFL